MLSLFLPESVPFKTTKGKKCSFKLLFLNGSKIEALHFLPIAENEEAVHERHGSPGFFAAEDFDDGEHRFMLIRGGSYYRARHFWHIEGGPHPVDSHEKVPLLNEALNRSATVGFRCVKEAGK